MYNNVILILSSRCVEVRILGSDSSSSVPRNRSYNCAITSERGTIVAPQPVTMGTPRRRARRLRPTERFTGKVRRPKTMPFTASQRAALSTYLTEECSTVRDQEARHMNGSS